MAAPEPLQAAVLLLGSQAVQGCLGLDPHSILVTPMTWLILLSLASLILLSSAACPHVQYATGATRVRLLTSLIASNLH